MIFFFSICFQLYSKEAFSLKLHLKSSIIELKLRLFLYISYHPKKISLKLYQVSESKELNSFSKYLEKLIFVFKMIQIEVNQENRAFQTTTKQCKRLVLNHADLYQMKDENTTPMIINNIKSTYLLNTITHCQNCSSRTHNRNNALEEQMGGAMGGASHFDGTSSMQENCLQERDECKIVNHAHIIIYIQCVNKWKCISV